MYKTHSRHCLFLNSVFSANAGSFSFFTFLRNLSLHEHKLATFPSELGASSTGESGGGEGERGGGEGESGGGEGESGGRASEHVAAVRVPSVHELVPETMYPESHVGWHVDPLGRNLVQSPTPPLVGALDVSQGGSNTPTPSALLGAKMILPLLATAAPVNL